jgi:hypothetical protein
MVKQSGGPILGFGPPVRFIPGFVQLCHDAHCETESAAPPPVLVAESHFAHAPRFYQTSFPGVNRKTAKIRIAFFCFPNARHLV